ncbi:uncharacterized protein LOC142327574 isoform X2 [Lycorma delicatula]|uniref:uncharacterized protein LOC142327574 isoform X2 n=1 Tax=Lycorma delicatula TaxID=130591 RepID=UPI003F514F3D
MLNETIFRKFRIVKKVTKDAVEDLKEQIKVEEANMLYLRHPFLTVEQSAGHAKELKKNEKWYMTKVIEREQKYISKGDKRIVDFVNYLKIAEDWDRIPS